MLNHPVVIALFLVAVLVIGHAADAIARRLCHRAGYPCRQHPSEDVRHLLWKGACLVLGLGVLAAAPALAGVLHR